MNISGILNEINSSAPQNKTVRDEQLRRAAAQFEALLLMQLTSALSKPSDDEDALFGSDGGSGLAQQMFAEQLATTMSEAGGIGLADTILQKFGVGQNNPSPNKFSKAMSAVRDIKEPLPLKNTATKRDISALVNKSVKAVPVADEAILNNSGNFEVVSTFADEVAKYGDADLPKPIAGDEKLFRYSRPRIVPDYALVSDVVQPKIPVSLNYQLPAKGRISSDFGNRLHPIDKKHKFHAGIDIAAPSGSPISAAAEGVVTFSGWRGGYGNLVIVQHPDGRETRYAHAKELFVKENQTVGAGEIIASVGSTGKSTGAHLHFEIRENGQPLNPLKFLP